jgi:LPS-assembly protein
MIPDFARYLVRHVRNAAPAVAMLLGLATPPLLLAQDNNPGDCAVNEKSTSGTCPARQAAATGPVAVTHPLDWAPLEAVPPALRTNECLICKGRYLDPLADEDTSVDPEEVDISALARTTELQGDIIRFTGGVDIAQGYRRFKGDEAEINRETGEAVLSGNVTLREPGILLQGQRAEIFSKTDEATLADSEFVIHTDHLQGTADLLQRDPQGLIHIHNGAFSYCAPGENDWNIQAKEVELDLEEGLGVARNARVNVAGYPIFYTPWLQFPLDDRRRTGLLWPDFGNDSTGGFDITVPIYFNLAPNYDALYSPRYIQERGLNHELKLRYLNKYLGYWTVGGAYMNSDDRYKSEVPDTRSDDRWLAIVRQDGLFEQRWRSHINYSKASDIDYMKDLETSSLTAQRRTSLPQVASLDYLGENWLINLDVAQFQPLAEDIEDIYKKLPQLTGQYRSRGNPFQIQPILLAQYSNFDADENVVTGQRVYTEAGAAYPMTWTYGFLKPTVKYRQLNYELSDGDFFSDDNPSAGSGLGSLDSGLYFERSTRFAGTDLLQTLEPRLYYQYSSYENQNDQPDFDSAELTFSYNALFRETRFSGHDRLDDSNRLSVGLSSQFIDSRTGQKLAGASIGQIFYFSDRKVRLIPGAPPLDQSGSEIAGEISFTPDNHLSVRTNLVWDPYTGNMVSGNVQAGYRLDNGSIFNTGYAYSRPLTDARADPNTEQVSASVYLPLDNNWRIFGAINYSVLDNTSIEEMAGVEYDNCCWTVRLLHLRYYDNATTGLIPDFNNPDLEQEHSTQVQIILKGMGGFGSRITNILEDMIRGYQERDY